MFTLVIGKDSVGKKSFVAQHIKLMYSDDTVFVHDIAGKLTDMLHEEGVQTTNQISNASIIVSDGILEKVKDRDLLEKKNVFFISNGENLTKDFVAKANKIVLFPVHNCHEISEVLDIPVDYLKSLKFYEPITVI